MTVWPALLKIFTIYPFTESLLTTAVKKEGKRSLVNYYHIVRFKFRFSKLVKIVVLFLQLSQNVQMKKTESGPGS